MQKPSPAEFATRESLIRSYVQGHTQWISEKLNCPIEETVRIELEFLPIVQLVSRHLFPGIPLADFQRPLLRRLMQLIQSVELPAHSVPAFRIRQTQSPNGLFKDRASVFEARWEDCPVFIRFDGLREPVILAGIPVTPAENPGEVCDCVILKRDVAPEFLQLIQHISAEDRASRLCVYGDGTRSIGNSAWDDLVLSESVVHLVRNDFESFLSREEWFRQNRLPFRRGYLLHGPPGNGKTSLIRTMLTTSGLSAYTIRLFQENTDDAHLERMFRCAANAAPSIVVIEDIDRAFPRMASPSSQFRVSLQQLLNCLDGIESQDGVVVVATANDPTVLDPAILRRPGRFDRVVAVPAPDRQLRLQYFRKFNPHLSHDVLYHAAENADGFSFAQLKEAYILAGQSAFERNAPITGDDLLRGIRALRDGLALVSDHKRKVGFVECAMDQPEFNAVAAVADFQ